MSNRGDFIRHGFRVRPAVNGGWSVITNAADPGDISDVAAFSNFDAMIDWLEDQHEGLVIGEMGRVSPRNEAKYVEEYFAPDCVVLKDADDV